MNRLRYVHLPLGMPLSCRRYVYILSYRDRAADALRHCKHIQLCCLDSHSKASVKLCKNNGNIAEKRTEPVLHLSNENHHTTTSQRK